LEFTFDRAEIIKVLCSLWKAYFDVTEVGRNMEANSIIPMNEYSE
jgi:hypothetical protein